MIESELAKLEELISATTPGPWFAHEDYHDLDEYTTQYNMVVSLDEEDPCDGFIFSSVDLSDIPDQTIADFEFIAAARSVVPALIAEIRRLRAIQPSAYEQAVLAAARIYRDCEEDDQDEALENLACCACSLEEPTP